MHRCVIDRLAGDAAYERIFSGASALSCVGYRFDRSDFRALIAKHSGQSAHEHGLSAFGLAADYAKPVVQVSPCLRQWCQARSKARRKLERFSRLIVGAVKIVHFEANHIRYHWKAYSITDGVAGGRHRCGNPLHWTCSGVSRLQEVLPGQRTIEIISPTWPISSLPPKFRWRQPLSLPRMLS